MNKSNWSFAAACQLAFIGLIMVGCGGTPLTNIRQDPDLAARTLVHTTVAVIPASAELSLGRGGNEGRLDEHSARISADLNRLLAEQFSDRGYDVRIVDSSQVYSGEVNHILTKIKVGMYGQGPVDPQAPDQTNFSLGSDVRPIADVASSDILVFASFSGWKRSGGSVAGEYLVKIFTMGSADATGAGNICVALVDAKSGDLLWGNTVYDHSLSPNPPDYEAGRLSKMLTEAFSSLILARQQ